MKHLILSLSIVICSTGLFAQNDHVKIISTVTNQVINGTTYKIYGDAARFEMKEKFYAVMESQDSSLVAIKRYEVSVIDSSEEYYCWYLCYLPRYAKTSPLWKAEDSLRMYQNDTIDDFSVYLRPHGTMGTACYRYVWQPEHDPTDSSWVDFCFEILTTGLEEEKNEISITSYPNPVVNELNLSISNVKEEGNMFFELRDVQGRLIYENTVNEGPNRFNFTKNAIEKGLYIGTIRNGKSSVWTERIVIE